MPRPRYPLERTGGAGGAERALSSVSLDIDELESSIATGLAVTPYTPAVLADWSGTSPGNLQAALDRIAAAIGPIP